MSHRVEIPPVIRRKIMSWSLPDEVLVEVYLRLTETLANNPASVLQRTRDLCAILVAIVLWISHRCGIWAGLFGGLLRLH
jgi:hypothetical protein